MPYITETEHSNIQKQLQDRSNLLEACKATMNYLKINHYNTPPDLVEAEEKMWQLNGQAISIAEKV